jgi:hypothetical protein
MSWRDGQCERCGEWGDVYVYDEATASQLCHVCLREDELDAVVEELQRSMTEDEWRELKARLTNPATPGPARLGEAIERLNRERKRKEGGR